MYLLPAGELESGEVCEQDLLEEDGGVIRRCLLAGQRIFLGSSENPEFCPLWHPLLDSAGAKVRVRPRTGEALRQHFILRLIFANRGTGVLLLRLVCLKIRFLLDRQPQPCAGQEYDAGGG